MRLARGEEIGVEALTDGRLEIQTADGAVRVTLDDARWLALVALPALIAGAMPAEAPEVPEVAADEIPGQTTIDDFVSTPSAAGG